MSNRKKISIKFEIERTENEYHLKMKLDQYKSETTSPIDTKLLTINTNKDPSYYDQPSVVITKWPLVK